MRQDKQNDGKVSVYARITMNKNRVELSIKRRVEPNGWNNGRGFAKPKTEALRLLNSYLEEVQAKSPSVVIYRSFYMQLLNGFLESGCSFFEITGQQYNWQVLHAAKKKQLQGMLKLVCVFQVCYSGRIYNYNQFIR
ncbi:Arm DNA-binding domain-containing protein [Ferruginibacter paludis]|nr:Arm DNA-binding domain-containing protein [Ferruginibacter paludis]MDN3656600.1 Arm DNA-binding domain-containing protein [Ferruginibacter paludis]